jgi:hypothetical protein
MLKLSSVGKIPELISSRNKSEKDVAKKVLITIMRFPSLNIDCQRQVGISGLFFESFEG